MSRLSANCILLLTAAIWGGGFVAQTTGMGRIGPFWFTGIRFGLALTAMLPFGIIEARRSKRSFDRSDLKLLVPLALSFAASSALQQAALLQASVTDVGFLTGLYVLFVPCLGVALFGERPHAAVWPASLIAIIGIFLLSGGGGRFGWGHGLTILASLGFSSQILLLGAAVRRTGRPLQAALCQSFACLVIGALGGILLEPLTASDIVSAIPSLAYSGFASAGLGFALQAVGQQYAPDSDAAIVMTMEAPFAALFGALMLGERLDAAGWFGCGLMLVSFLLVQLAPLFRRRPLANRPLRLLGD
jgi:drug/metabolite transporter (DMT)-like permease